MLFNEISYVNKEIDSVISRNTCNNFLQSIGQVWRGYHWRRKVVVKMPQVFNLHYGNSLII